MEVRPQGAEETPGDLYREIAEGLRMPRSAGASTPARPPSAGTACPSCDTFGPDFDRSHVWSQLKAGEFSCLGVTGLLTFEAGAQVPRDKPVHILRSGPGDDLRIALRCGRFGEDAGEVHGTVETWGDEEYPCPLDG
ncbi:hypothetical protein PJ985_08295 [Streptomyces sp. ACA25]|uniref:hypothetical protein n=1 Tax=Streptomyces sp. ACA25 TaxID=3022596 RepID=UPI002306E6F1|nr:hypothetical protein [Streptomyces sp. ACA25]MDB1087565.1 hypothetical protein [Streptomyces sp. ACA25]